MRTPTAYARDRGVCEVVQAVAVAAAVVVVVVVVLWWLLRRSLKRTELAMWG